MATVETPDIVGSSDMDAYRKLVQDLMRDAQTSQNSISRVFENSGKEHARVVIDTMLENASESVDIFGEEADVSVVDPALLRKVATNPQMSVRMLVEVDDPFSRPSSALSQLTDLVKSERILVRRFAQHEGLHIGHMTIVDRKYLRLETDHGSRKAIVSFAAPQAQSVANSFERLWNLGAQLRADG